MSAPPSRLPNHGTKYDRQMWLREFSKKQARTPRQDLQRKRCNQPPFNQKPAPSLDSPISKPCSGPPLAGLFPTSCMKRNIRPLFHQSVREREPIRPAPLANARERLGACVPWWEPSPTTDPLLRSLLSQIALLALRVADAVMRCLFRLLV